MNRILLSLMRRSGITFLLDYAYDAGRFLWSKNTHSRVRDMDPEEAKMHLLRLSHSLEKGLALPEPKLGFGKEKAIHLKHEADAYLDKFGRDDIYRLTLATLAAHQQWQEANGGEHAGFSITDLVRQSDGAEAGVRTVFRDSIWARSRIDFEAFVRSRHSIRNFTGEPVHEEDVLKAIGMATKSPSVCNRSCARAYYAVNPKTINDLLAHQNGNRGFGERAGAVVVVAADMRAFYKNGERNQGWIDGGLFAMSLNYAFHALGYGACMLNWSMDATHDRPFRKIFRIPREHLVIMLMAVGHIPPVLQVAESPRRDISEFAIRIEK